MLAVFEVACLVMFLMSNLFEWQPCVFVVVYVHPSAFDYGRKVWLLGSLFIVISNILLILSFQFSISRDIVFGPPGRSKAGILFYFCNMFLWGYPVYFYYVSIVKYSPTSIIIF